MPNAEIKNKIVPDLALKQPPLFKIIYLNDERTSMEFVITTLMEYFHYTENDALMLTTDIHEQGSAVVAVLPHEIAEQRGIEVTLDARAHGYPLQIKIEADE